MGRKEPSKGCRRFLRTILCLIGGMVVGASGWATTYTVDSTTATDPTGFQTQLSAAGGGAGNTVNFNPTMSGLSTILSAGLSIFNAATINLTNVPGGFTISTAGIDGALSQANSLTFTGPGIFYFSNDSFFENGGPLILNQGASVFFSGSSGSCHFLSSIGDMALTLNQGSSLTLSGGSVVQNQSGGGLKLTTTLNQGSSITLLAGNSFLNLGSGDMTTTLYSGSSITLSGAGSTFSNAGNSSGKMITTINQGASLTLSGGTNCQFQNQATTGDMNTSVSGSLILSNNSFFSNGPTAGDMNTSVSGSLILSNSSQFRNGTGGDAGNMTTTVYGSVSLDNSSFQNASDGVGTTVGNMTTTVHGSVSLTNGSFFQNMISDPSNTVGNMTTAVYGSLSLADGSCFYNDGTGDMTTNVYGSLSLTNTSYFQNANTGNMITNIYGSLSLTDGSYFLNSNAYGQTTINVASGGTLFMDGSYYGNDAISGLGTVASLIVSSGGTFSSGVNGAQLGGTLPSGWVTSANLILSSGATYQAAIGTATGGGDSHPVQILNVPGSTSPSTATLGGATLNVTSTSSASVLAGRSFMIMSADSAHGNSITGNYGPLTSSSLLVYSVAYNLPTSVSVNVNADQSWAGYVGSGAAGNEIAMANYLDTCGNLGSDPAFIVLNNYRLAGNTVGYDNALNQIVNSQTSALGTSNMNNMTALTGTTGGQVQAWLTDRGTSQGKIQGTAFAVGLSTLEPERLAAFDHLVTQSLTDTQGILALAPSATYAPPQRKGIVPRMGFTNSPEQLNRHVEAGRIQVGKANVWVQPYGQLTSQTGDGNGNPSIKTQTGGIVFGGDYEVTPNTLIGVLGGTSNTPFTWGSNRGNGHMNSGFGGLYGAWKEGDGFYVEAQTIFGGNAFRTNRNINYSTISRTASGNHSAFQFTGNLELGYALPVYDWLTCQPFILGDYMVMSESGYTETGADSLNMAVKSKTSQFFQGEIGAMVYQTFMVGETLLRPTAELGWMIRTPVGNTANVNGGLINQPSTLVVTGVNKVYNQIAPGVGLIAQFENGLYSSANVYAEWGGGLNIGEVLVRVGYEF